MTVPPSLLRNLRPFNQAQIPLTSRFLFHSLKTPFFCKYFPCSFLLLLKLSIFIISYNSISCNIFSISHIFLRSDKQKSTFPSFFYLSHTQRTALQFLKPVPLPPLKKNQLQLLLPRLFWQPCSRAHAFSFSGCFHLKSKSNKVTSFVLYVTWNWHQFRHASGSCPFHPLHL